MRFYQTFIEYAIKLSKEEFSKIIQNDDKNSQKLRKILEQVDGIDKIDYNSHFGSFIFFRIQKGKDTPQKQADIQRIIEKYIQ